MKIYWSNYYEDYLFDENSAICGIKAYTRYLDNYTGLFTLTFADDLELIVEIKGEL